MPAVTVGLGFGEGLSRAARTRLGGPIGFEPHLPLAAAPCRDAGWPAAPGGPPGVNGPLVCPDEEATIA